MEQNVKCLNIFSWEVFFVWQPVFDYSLNQFFEKSNCVMLFPIFQSWWSFKWGLICICICIGICICICIFVRAFLIFQPWCSLKWVQWPFDFQQWYLWKRWCAHPPIQLELNWDRKSLHWPKYWIKSLLNLCEGLSQSS